MTCPDAPPRTPTHRYGPILLSGLVCPGLGQLLQRRKLSGTLFLLTFLACAAWMLTEVGLTFIDTFAVLRALLDNQAADPFPTGRILPTLAAMGAALVIYLANLADVVRAQRASHGSGQDPHLPPDGG